MIVPDFQSPPQWESCWPLPQEVPSFEISKHSLEEEHVCSDNLCHHLGNPRTNHTVSFQLHQESICKPGMAYKEVNNTNPDV